MTKEDTIDQIELCTCDRGKMLCKDGSSAVESCDKCNGHGFRPKYNGGSVTPNKGRESEAT